MTNEKMSPETATMLSMQRLIGIADEIFDQVESKSGNQFMVITIANDFKNAVKTGLLLMRI